jgi:hypothetical protein
MSPLPLGKGITGIEEHAGGGDGRHPENQWRFIAVVSGAIATLPRSGVGSAKAYHWPSVIGTGFQQVDFITAIGAVLILPDLSCGGVDSQSQSTAVAPGVDFRAGIVTVEERIVAGRTAVIIEPEDFTTKALEVLGVLATGGQVEPGLIVEDEPASATDP